LLTATAFAGAASPAVAEPAVGVVKGAGTLVTFDTAAPGTFTGTKPVTGLAVGESLVDVD
jgi:hypothetical protein